MMPMTDIIMSRKSVLPEPSFTTLFFSIIITLFSINPALAASVTLTWQRNQEPDIVGYLLSWGTESHMYTKTKFIYDTSTAPAQRIYTVDELEEGRVYYFALRAVDFAGQVSDYSKEVIKDLSEANNAASPLLALYTSAGLEPDFEKYPVVSGDINGDDRTDLILFGETGVFVSLSDGTNFGQPSRWYDYLTNSGYSNSLSPDRQELGWSVQGTGDINGDGYDDIVLINAQTGTLSIWFMNDAGFEHELVIDQLVAYAGTLFGPEDFDGNGTADLLWFNSYNGELHCWFMDENGVTDDHFLGTMPDLSGEIADLADYDGNGTADILWYSSEHNYFLACFTIDKAVSQCADLGEPEDETSIITASGDFDGDGNQDILWRNRENGDFYAWLMDGKGLVITMPIGSIPATNWRIFDTGDINGDGLADIIWRYDETGDFIPLVTQ